MPRLAALATLVLAALLLSPSSAFSDGCPLPCSGVNSSPPGSQLVYVQPDGDRGRLIAYDTATRRTRFTLPAGMASANGKRFFSATALDAFTSLMRFDTATGRLVHAWRVDGRWALAGISPSGRWLALAALGKARGTTTVAIVDSARRAIAHRLRLAGSFEVETVSADGKRLFLIEHLRGGRYLVRLYDLSRQALRANPLRSRGADQVMAGLAWSGLASPNGRWLLTLYLSTARDTAFVHALDLDRAAPACIDLPSGKGALEQLKRYSLTLDAGRLYAANPDLGVVAEVDLERSRVGYVGRFEPSGGETPASTTSALSLDGKTLVFAQGRDLWAYDVAHGEVRGPYETWAKTVGLGFSRDSKEVFVVRADGRMLAFDAATGRRRP